MAWGCAHGAGWPEWRCVRPLLALSLSAKQSEKQQRGAGECIALRRRGCPVSGAPPPPPPPQPPPSPNPPKSVLPSYRPRPAFPCPRRHHPRLHHHCLRRRSRQYSRGMLLGPTRPSRPSWGRAAVAPGARAGFSASVRAGALGQGLDKGWGRPSRRGGVSSHL